MTQGNARRLLGENAPERGNSHWKTDSWYEAGLSKDLSIYVVAPLGVIQNEYN